MTHDRFARIRLGCISCAVAVVLTACGSGASKSSSPTSSSPRSSTATGSGQVTTAPAPAAGSTATTATAAVAGSHSSGHVGATLSDPDKYLASDVATVTLVKVIDPVTPVTASNVPDAGSRWVGLEMTFVDNGSNAADASDQAVVTASDGKVYAINADINGNFTECKSTMNDLKPDQKATFCPGFLLPNGVTITKVGYSTRATDISVPPDITWTVP